MGRHDPALAYWTIRGQTNSRSVKLRTGPLADRSTRRRRQRIFF